MKTLDPNADLALPTKQPTRLILSWAASSPPVDVLCFPLGANARVPGDEWLVFFNQPRSPGQIIELGLEAHRAALSVQTAKLPASIQRCLIVVVPESDQGFARVRDLQVDIQLPASPAFRYRVPLPSQGKAQLVVELLRGSGGWRLRTQDQALELGLEALVTRYGVAVSESPQPAPPPPDPTPANERQGAAGGGNQPPRPRRRRRRGCGLLLLMLLVALGGAWYYFRPANLPDPTQLISRVEELLPRTGPPPVVAEPPGQSATESCTLGTEEVMDRYHQLGENYLKINDLIEESNAIRANFSRQLRELELVCPEPYKQANQAQLDMLESLPIAGWYRETELLSLCIGGLNDEVQASLERSNPVAVTRRLTQQADDYRRVESDLTNIARELAYFHNKQQRLEEAFQTHLDICTQFE